MLIELEAEFLVSINKAKGFVLLFELHQSDIFRWNFLIVHLYAHRLDERLQGVGARDAEESYYEVRNCKRRRQLSLPIYLLSLACLKLHIQHGVLQLSYVL